MANTNGQYIDDAIRAESNRRGLPPVQTLPARPTGLTPSGLPYATNSGNSQYKFFPKTKENTDLATADMVIGKTPVNFMPKNAGDVADTKAVTDTFPVTTTGLGNAASYVKNTGLLGVKDAAVNATSNAIPGLVAEENKAQQQWKDAAGYFLHGSSYKPEVQQPEQVSSVPPAVTTAKPPATTAAPVVDNVDVFPYKPTKQEPIATVPTTTPAADAKTSPSNGLITTPIGKAAPYQYNGSTIYAGKDAEGHYFAGDKAGLANARNLDGKTDGQRWGNQKNNYDDNGDLIPARTVDSKNFPESTADSSVINDVEQSQPPSVNNTPAQSQARGLSPVVATPEQTGAVTQASTTGGVSPYEPQTGHTGTPQNNGPTYVNQGATNLTSAARGLPVQPTIQPEATLQPPQGLGYQPAQIKSNVLPDWAANKQMQRDIRDAQSTVLGAHDMASALKAKYAQHFLDRAMGNDEHNMALQQQSNQQGQQESQFSRAKQMEGWKGLLDSGDKQQDNAMKQQQLGLQQQELGMKGDQYNRNIGLEYDKLKNAPKKSNWKSMTNQEEIMTINPKTGLPEGTGVLKNVQTVADADTGQTLNEVIAKREKTKQALDMFQNQLKLTPDKAKQLEIQNKINILQQHLAG